MEIIVAEKLLFFFSKLEFFTNSIFNTLVRKEKDLPTPLFILSITYLEVKDNSNQLSLSFSNDDFSFLQRSTKICHKPTRYGLVAEYIIFLSIAQIRFMNYSLIIRRFDFEKLIYGKKL